MNKETDIIILASFLSVGIILLSAVVVIWERIVVLPILLLGIVFLILTLLQVNPKIAHTSENLEKFFFILTLLIISASFIILYKPA
jgi:hypothetical protein